MKKLFLLFALPALLAGCGDDTKKPKRGGDETQAVEPRDQQTFLVVDANNRPLAGAKILVGDALNSPIPNNFLTTDSTGQVRMPEGWTTPLPVTVEAAGHVRLTHLERRPGGGILRLRKPAQVPTVEMNGRTTGHAIKDYDGYMDFGLVISGLKRNDILAFDIGKVISAQVDTISVMGQSLDVPSNIALPRQRESYILPITIDKPQFRLSFADAGEQVVFAARGRFPFKKVIDEVRARKKFYELINHFDIQGGVVRQIAARAGYELPVNELNFTTKRTFKAPSIRSSEVLIGLAAAEMNGVMIPTDVKKIESKQSMAMSVEGSSPALAIGVLKNASEFEGGTGGADRLSAVLLPFGSGVAPQFLDLIANPRFVSDEVQMTRPRALNGVHELATLAIFSDVREIPMGSNGSLPFLIHKWEVYAPSWVEKMDLPQWPLATPQPTKKRWEVTFIGSQLKEAAELGQPVIDAATHVTHSSLDF